MKQNGKVVYENKYCKWASFTNSAHYINTVFVRETSIHRFSDIINRFVVSNGFKFRLTNFIKLNN